MFDTGASINVTPSKKDFVTYKPTKASIDGISEATGVVGVGTVEWKLRDDKGKAHKVRCDANHVPSARVRLFSPQV